MTFCRNLYLQPSCLQPASRVAASGGRQATRRQLSLTSVAVALACCVCLPASAQQLQTGGGFSSGQTGQIGSGSSMSSGSGSSSQSSSSSTRSASGISNSNALQNNPAGVSVTQPAGFVGANAAQEFVGATREAATTSRNNRQFRGIQDTTSQRRSSTQQTGTPRSIPVGLRVGFSTPSLASSMGRLAAANAASFQPFSEALPELQAVNVQLSSTGVARLSGKAATMEARRLAANLMRLQPGVRSIDNQIEVAAD